MTIEFYFFPGSLPCKVVWSVLEVLKIPYEKKYLDLFGKKEQKTPEYLKINPAGKVPFIMDDGYGLGESRAIVSYLCSKYEEGDKKNKLYPTDLKARGLVDEAMNQDFQFTADMVEYTNLRGVLYLNEIGPAVSKWDKVVAFLNSYEGRLARHRYMAADHVTLADYSALSSVAGFDAFIPESEKEKYPRLSKWKKEMMSLPEYEICYGDSSAQLKAYYDKIVQERSKTS